MRADLVRLFRDHDGSPGDGSLSFEGEYLVAVGRARHAAPGTARQTRAATA
jgi:hypothetical protein